MESKIQLVMQCSNCKKRYLLGEIMQLKNYSVTIAENKTIYSGTCNCGNSIKMESFITELK